MHSPLLFLGDLGGGELMLIMVVILIFFGANKIPELARGLGKGIREFKDASSEIRNEFEKVAQTPPQQPYQQPPYQQQPYQQQPYQQPAPLTPTNYAAAPTGYETGPASAPVQHHDTPLPGATSIGEPLGGSTSSSAPAYGTPEPTRPRLDQTHSSEA